LAVLHYLASTLVSYPTVHWNGTDTTSLSATVLTSVRQRF